MPRGKTPGAPPVRLRRLPLYPGPGNRERSSSAEGLRLVPLETRAEHRYRPLDPGISPPWQKEVYDEPESEGS